MIARLAMRSNRWTINISIFNFTTVLIQPILLSLYLTNITKIKRTEKSQSILFLIEDSCPPPLMDMHVIGLAMFLYFTHTCCHYICCHSLWFLFFFKILKTGEMIGEIIADNIAGTFYLILYTKIYALLCGKHAFIHFDDVC